MHVWILNHYACMLHGTDPELHVILDNLNTHKPKHDRWLTRHPNVHFHFTPTKACWLNQIEIWFGVLQRRLLRRGEFSSKADLTRQLLAYLEYYNVHWARPYRWTYTGQPLAA